MNICIFEDFFVSKLEPLNLLRHTSMLICGVSSLQGKILRNLPDKTKLTFHTRKYIAPWLQEVFPNAAINKLNSDEYIFFNARLLAGSKEIKKILKTLKAKRNTALVTPENIVIAFHTNEKNTRKYTEIINPEDDNLVSYADIEWLGLGLNRITTDEFLFINNVSDLILYQATELQDEMDLIVSGKKRILNHSKKTTDRNAVLDSSAGKIFIGKNTIIEPFTYIKGPVYIGDGCTIRSGSQLYGPVRIGCNSKVSGEITCSTLHSYVNKQHYGFLGHSYLCEWVNLGAGTTTSNLKNNYSKITLDIEGEKINTDSIFLGSLFGDHTKTGIHTMLNTGSVVGISTNLYGAGYHSKKINSFTWDDASSGSNIEYEIDKAVETARVSMKRRNIEMSPAYESMLRYVFEKISENSI
jgi:UDP-N-acetylglucosamine diphosphorylase / glucose-1-phosphate thymidylyltransferase / UDP-N-acetylgalactosamine diphosphorylase / glucosamine-1-phosphate N-acetyltransferase / galactosamine-1-phosphate N-acetyltransferase